MTVAEHGGYRKPSNHAQVSGPGQYSARTDGQAAQYVSGLPYGEGQQFMDLQRQAPMAAVPASNPTSPSATGTAAITPFAGLGDPTQAPNEPVTAGSPFGPGAGPTPTAAPGPNDGREKIASILPTLIRMADLPDTPPATRAAIRYLRGVIQ